jgi:hypothetical protein
VLDDSSPALRCADFPALAQISRGRLLSIAIGGSEANIVVRGTLLNGPQNSAAVKDLKLWFLDRSGAVMQGCADNQRMATMTSRTRLARTAASASGTDALMAKVSVISVSC